MLVLGEHEDGLLSLASLRDVLRQVLQGLGAQGVEHVEVAEEGGQREDDHRDAHAHLEERRAGQGGARRAGMLHIA